MTTPWGPAQHREIIADGITFISTARHGGYLISPDRLMQMPKRLRAYRPFAGPHWYEEDQDWMIVALAFPDLFDGHAVWHAVRGVEHGWFSGGGKTNPIRSEDVPEASREKADAWFVETNQHWEKRSACTTGDGWLVDFVRLADGARVTRQLSGGEYLNLPAVVDELPGEAVDVEL